MVVSCGPIMPTGMQTAVGTALQVMATEMSAQTPARLATATIVPTEVAPTAGVVIKLPPEQVLTLPLPTPSPGPSPTRKPYEAFVMTNGDDIAITREIFLSNGWEIHDSVAPLCAIPGTGLSQGIIVGDAEDVVWFALNGSETEGLVLWVIVSDLEGQILSSGPLGYISEMRTDGVICIQSVQIKKLEPTG